MGFGMGFDMGYNIGFGMGVNTELGIRTIQFFTTRNEQNGNTERQKSHLEMLR